MTQEEKAKAYDEALKKAKDMLSYKEVRREDMEYLFPELKESEDERIRKDIVTYLKSILSNKKYGDKFIEDWIAWLEKQGEQPKKHDVCDYCDQQGSCVSPCPMKLVEKQAEQKPAWSEEDEYHKRQILRILKDNGCSQTLQERTEKWIEERLKSLKPQNTWKPSDEQMNALDDVISSRDIKYDVLSELWKDLKKL